MKKSFGGLGGEKRRFQYLSPFQNRMKTRPLKELVEKQNKKSTTQQIAGVFFLACVLFWLPFQVGVT